MWGLRASRLSFNLALIQKRGRLLSSDVPQVFAKNSLYYFLRLRYYLFSG